MSNIDLHIIGSKFFSELLNELDLNYTIKTAESLKYNNKDFLVRIVFVDELQLAELKSFF